MEFVKGWSWRPYAELINQSRAVLPYVCRLSHDEHSFTADYIDNGCPNAAHTLYWRVRNEGDFTAVPACGGTVTVKGLPEDVDYEFYIARNDDISAKSQTRLVRTGFVPGKVIGYLHPEDTAYEFAGTAMASSSLVKLPSGRLISAIEHHKTNEYHGENFTMLYFSEDNGETWHYLCELFPCSMGNLFVDGGKLYCLGVSRNYGDLLIGRSDDEGATWCTPTVLLRGSSIARRGGCHRTPMPILHHNGRLITDFQAGSWAAGVMLNAVLSAKEGSDLLDATNWAISQWWDVREHKEIERVKNGGITGDDDAFKHTLGPIEGSPVVAPNGDVWLISRFGRRKPLVVEYDPQDPWGELKNARLIDMPIMDAKAPIQFDAVSGRYYMLCSYAPEGRTVRRTMCALMYSTNLQEWVLDHIVMDFSDLDIKKYGIQYFHFLFDGEDIIFVTRTAFCNSATFHDSNHQTFHRIKNFRK